MTQAQLAKFAGCAQATVADIERGRASESAKIPEIAAALGLHPMWLKEGRGPKHLASDTLDESGLYVTDPKIIAIAKTLMQAQEAGREYLVDKTQKELALDAELADAAIAGAKANDC